MAFNTTNKKILRNCFKYDNVDILLKTKVARGVELIFFSIYVSVRLLRKGAQIVDQRFCMLSFSMCSILSSHSFKSYVLERVARWNKNISVRVHTVDEHYRIVILSVLCITYSFLFRCSVRFVSVSLLCFDFHYSLTHFYVS